MAEIKRVVVSPVGGSLRNGIPANLIGDNEWASLRNFYQYAGKLRTRPGSAKVTATAYGSPLSGLFAYKTAAGAWTLMVGLPTGLGKLSGSAIAVVPITDGQTYSSSVALWSMVQYLDTVYAARPSTGTLKRATDQFVMDAGLAAPVTAPTLADGAAGAILAGTYYAVYTFYNPATGEESNPSPASVAYVAPGSKKINWSGMDIATNGQITQKRLYRTLQNQTGAYFFVDTIPNNQTTYTGDNNLTSQLGDSVAFNNGLPPANIQLLEVYKERLWCTDGVDLFFSNYQLPESFDPLSLIPVFPDDGHTIRALKAWGDLLFVGKTNGVHIISTQDGANFNLRTLSVQHGCWSHFSVQDFERGLAWYGGDDFYITNGGEPRAFGDSRIRTILDSIPEAYRQNVVSAVWPALNWYVAAVPTGTSTTPTKLLVYNYREDTWTTFDYQSGAAAPTFLADFFDTNYGRQLYGTFQDGHVWNLVSAVHGDDTVAIACSALGKAFSFGAPGDLHMMRNLEISCDSVPETLSIALYRDRAAAAYKTRSVSLAGPAGWKAARLSSQFAPSYLTQLGLSYSGMTDLVIDEIAFDVIVSAARRRPSI